MVSRWLDEVWNPGPEEFGRFHDSLRAQFSDFKITPVISLAEGDLACVHWSCCMIHTATQKPLQLTGTSVVRVENGRFAEAWQNWDAAHLHAQLTGTTSSFRFASVSGR